MCIRDRTDSDYWKINGSTLICLPVDKYGCLTCCRAFTTDGDGRGRALGLFHPLEPETELTAPAPAEVEAEGNSLESILGGDGEIDAGDC